MRRQPNISWEGNASITGEDCSLTSVSVAIRLSKTPALFKGRGGRIEGEALFPESIAYTSSCTSDAMMSLLTPPTKYLVAPNP